MTRLMRQDKDLCENFTEYRKIISFRNALIHGYDTIDDVITWGVITVKLRTLRIEIDQSLSR